MIPTDFLELSARIGRDPLLVQGPGGNTSIKLGNTMWVKASGTWLADSCGAQCFVPINLSAARKLMQQGIFEFDESVLAQPSSLRPSIETALHALLAQRVVLHVHSVNSIAWALAAEPAPELKRRLDGIDWLWIPYHRPGAPLAQSILRLLTPQISVLLLQNHGLVVGADSVESAQNILSSVEERLLLNATASQSSHSAHYKLPESYQLSSDPALRVLTADSQLFERARRGFLFPDQVVFLKDRVAYLSDPAELAAEYSAADQKLPAILACKDYGVAHQGEQQSGSWQNLLCLANVLSRSASFQDLRYLTQSEVNELVNWDAEKYRQKIQAV